MKEIGSPVCHLYQFWLHRDDFTAELTGIGDDRGYNAVETIMRTRRSAKVRKCCGLKCNNICEIFRTLDIGVFW